MASTEDVVQRLRESRPPATDAATYLTILEMSLSPSILPALQDILQDAALTSEIGWDLVEMLIRVPGSEACLESVARLGNPREVILKVLEVMDNHDDDRDAESQGEGEGEGEGSSSSSTRPQRFVTLCGMLGILHKRLRVKAPSRFLHTTLDTVLRAYAASPGKMEATAAVIKLVQALASFTRPPLPSRKASAVLEMPFPQQEDAERAPDPEGEEPNVGEGETKLVMRLLQAFITCVVEEFVNANGLEWAARLLEYEFPERVVTGRPSMMSMFRERDDLHMKDALVGQLVSLASDLGLAHFPPFKIRELLLEAPTCRNPLAEEDAERVQLSTGGLLCLNAYWMFAADVFDADRGLPHDGQLFPQYMLPEHHRLLQRYLGDEPQAQIARSPGTVEALVVMAISLGGKGRLFDENEKDSAEVMPYHHLLTLVSVFHENLRVRNAATVVAGSLLHADPDEDSRLAIMEDLLENCMFSSLQACAVTWLREEIILANDKKKKDKDKEKKRSRFSTHECLETMQYTLFPDLTRLNGADPAAVLEFWSASAPLHLQVANFALFLFSGEEYRELAPAGMAAAIEHRYVEPLVLAAGVLSRAIREGEVQGVGGETVMQLSILTDTLGRVPLQ